jgi:hypothetical protein
VDAIFAQAGSGLLPTQGVGPSMPHRLTLSKTCCIMSFRCSISLFLATNSPRLSYKPPSKTSAAFRAQLRLICRFRTFGSVDAFHAFVERHRKSKSLSFGAVIVRITQTLAMVEASSRCRLLAASWTAHPRSAPLATGGHRY